MKITFALTALLGTASLVSAALGPIITAPNPSVIMKKATVYPIYFGQWAPARMAKVQKFLQDLGASDWFRTDKVNYGLQSLVLGKSAVIPSNVTRLNQYDWGAVPDGEFSKLVYDPVKSTNDVLKVIYQTIQAKKVPADDNGIYMLLPSRSVDLYSNATDSTWNSYCAFHDYFFSNLVLGGRPVKYAVVGDLEQCSQNNYVSKPALGGDYGLEAIASMAYHELVETMTDPMDGGYDVTDPADPYFNYENADLCGLDFGYVCPDQNGAYYNTVINGVKYMLQTNYNPNARKCGNFGGLPTRRPNQSCIMMSPGF